MKDKKAQSNSGSSTLTAFYDYLVDLDLYGTKPGFKINFKDNFKTAFGSTLSIFSIIVSIISFFYFSLQIFDVTNPRLVFSITNIFNPALIVLDQDNFGFAFGLQNPFTYDQFIDESVYYPLVYQMTGSRVQKGNDTVFEWTVNPLELERCSIKKFPKVYRKIMKDLPFESYYCLRNTTFSVEGTFLNSQYSYLMIKLYECKNATNRMERIVKANKDVDRKQSRSLESEGDKGLFNFNHSGLGSLDSISNDNKDEKAFGDHNVNNNAQNLKEFSGKLRYLNEMEIVKSRKGFKVLFKDRNSDQFSTKLRILESLDLRGLLSGSDSSSKAQKPLHCKSKEYIDKILAGTFFNLPFTDITIDPTNYKNANQILTGDSYTTVSNKFFKEMHHYLKQIEMTTDNGLLFSEKQTYNYLQNDFIKEMTDFRKADNFLSYSIKLSTRKETFNRSYAKLQNIAAELGGILKLLNMTCMIFSFYFNKTKFYELIANEIFDVNLDEKGKFRSLRSFTTNLNTFYNGNTNKNNNFEQIKNSTDRKDFNEIEKDNDILINKYNDGENRKNASSNKNSNLNDQSEDQLNAGFTVVNNINKINVKKNCNEKTPNKFYTAENEIAFNNKRRVTAGRLCRGSDNNAFTDDFSCVSSVNPNAIGRDSSVNHYVGNLRKKENPNEKSAKFKRAKINGHSVGKEIQKNSNHNYNVVTSYNLKLVDRGTDKGVCAIDVADEKRVNRSKKRKFENEKNLESKSLKKKNRSVKNMLVINNDYIKSKSPSDHSNSESNKGAWLDLPRGENNGLGSNLNSYCSKTRIISDLSKNKSLNKSSHKKVNNFTAQTDKSDDKFISSEGEIRINEFQEFKKDDYTNNAGNNYNNNPNLSLSRRKEAFNYTKIGLSKGDAAIKLQRFEAPLENEDFKNIGVERNLEGYTAYKHKNTENSKHKNLIFDESASEINDLERRFSNLHKANKADLHENAYENHFNKFSFSENEIKHQTTDTNALDNSKNKAEQIAFNKTIINEENKSSNTNNTNINYNNIYLINSPNIPFDGMSFPQINKDLLKINVSSVETTTNNQNNTNIKSKVLESNFPSRKQVEMLPNLNKRNELNIFTEEDSIIRNLKYGNSDSGKAKGIKDINDTIIHVDVKAKSLRKTNTKDSINIPKNLGNESKEDFGLGKHYEFKLTNKLNSEETNNNNIMSSNYEKSSKFAYYKGSENLISHKNNNKDNDIEIPKKKDFPNKKLSENVDIISKQSKSNLDMSINLNKNLNLSSQKLLLLNQENNEPSYLDNNYNGYKENSHNQNSKQPLNLTNLNYRNYLNRNSQNFNYSPHDMHKINGKQASKNKLGLKNPFLAKQLNTEREKEKDETVQHTKKPDNDEGSKIYESSNINNNFYNTNNLAKFPNGTFHQAKYKTRLKFFDSICYLLCRLCKKRSKNFMIIDRVKLKADDLLDIVKFIKEIIDIERLKRILLDRDQLTLFEYPFYLPIMLECDLLKIRNTLQGYDGNQNYKKNKVLSRSNKHLEFSQNLSYKIAKDLFLSSKVDKSELAKAVERILETSRFDNLAKRLLKFSNQDAVNLVK